VQLTASGGTSPYTFAIVSGAPTGCAASVSSAGFYACTPTAAGNFNAFVIRVTDSLAATSTKTFTQLVGAPQNPGVATCAQTTITLGSSTQCTATVNFSDGSSRNVTSGNSLVAGTPQTLLNTPVSSVTVPITITAGANNGYAACARQGADTTSPIVYTDSASQTPTVIKTVVTTHFASCALLLNTVGVTSVTANTTAAASTMALTVFPVSGIPSSAALDGTAVSNALTGSTALSSQACGPYTTTNAVDILFCFQDQQSAENSFSATNAFNIPNTAQNARTAIAYEIFSTTQSALSPTISWTPGTPTSAGNIMFALKAASGTSNGASWNATNGAINSTGLFTANGNSGAASVSFTYGAVTSNTVALTVNSTQMDTAICINTTGPTSPCPAVNVSGAAGQVVNFTAIGNVTGSNYTSQATWSSSNTNVATIPAKGQAQCASGLASPSQTTITAAFAPFTSGTATLTCNPPISGNGLLSGCVVNESNNSPSCSIPSGWSLVCAEGFAGGTTHCNSSQSFGYLNNAQGGINGTQPHTGSFSLQGTYGSDGDVIADNIGIPGSFSSVYISYWDWVSSNALYPNSDYFLVDLRNPAGCGAFAGFGQDIGIDAQNYASGLSLSSYTSGGFIVISQGDPGNSACVGNYEWNNNANLSINRGTWRQYEFLITPSTTGNGQTNPMPNNCSTPTSATGCGNGTLKMWVNGQQVLPGNNNLNLNGTQSMVNAGTFVQVGGTITDFNSSSGGSVNCNPFSSCPGTQPGTGAPPIYQRIIDDIIVMTQ